MSKLPSEEQFLRIEELCQQQGEMAQTIAAMRQDEKAFERVAAEAQQNLDNHRKQIESFAKEFSRMEASIQKELSLGGGKSLDQPKQTLTEEHKQSEKKGKQKPLEEPTLELHPPGMRKPRPSKNEIAAELKKMDQEASHSKGMGKSAFNSETGEGHSTKPPSYKR